MSGLLAAIGNAVSSAMVKSAGGIINEAISQSPEYQNYQRRVQQYAHQNEMVAMAGLATSVTFGTLGLCFLFSGRNDLGSGLMIAAVPIGYFSYNSNKIYENMRNDFAENIIQHLAPLKEGEQAEIDTKKLRVCLGKGTVCYNLFVDFHVNQFKAYMEPPVESEPKPKVKAKH